MRSAVRFVCQSCGAATPKWLGRCPECDAWDSLVETAVAPPGATTSHTVSAPMSVADIPPQSAVRLSSGIPEFDRVLGGGFVSGMVALIGGEPGAGKSTLLTQAAAQVALSGSPVLYISGEESASQVRLRCERLRAADASFLVSNESDIDVILGQISGAQPALTVLDSIQTVSDRNLDSAPGSISQVRACANRLIRHAKEHGTAVALIGHVTRDGSVAGPRALEHAVDTLLTFEGDSSHRYRMLRGVKNRFGSTDELGVFEMGSAGLTGVEDPSLKLLEERADGPGSVVTAVMEGSRSLLAEVQALVSRTNMPTPRRAVSGLNANRVAMLLAVLERRLGMRLSDQDVFGNVAGGLRIEEPAADLAIAVAVASSLSGMPVPRDMIAIGEIGLSGEVRAVPNTERRLREAQRHGIRTAIVAVGMAADSPRLPGLTVLGARNLLEAVDATGCTKPVGT